MEYEPLMVPKEFGLLRNLLMEHLPATDNDACHRKVVKLFKSMFPAFVVDVVDYSEFREIADHVSKILRAGYHMATDEERDLNWHDAFNALVSWTDAVVPKDYDSEDDGESESDDGDDGLDSLDEVEDGSADSKPE